MASTIVGIQSVPVIGCRASLMTVQQLAYACLCHILIDLDFVSLFSEDFAVFKRLTAKLQAEIDLRLPALSNHLQASKIKL